MDNGTNGVGNDLIRAAKGLPPEEGEAVWQPPPPPPRV